MWQIFYGHFRHHWVRQILAVLAISLSVSLVVTMTSAYEAGQAAAQEMLSRYMGDYEVKLEHRDHEDAGVHLNWIRDLKEDPRIERLGQELHLRMEFMPDPTKKLWRIEVMALSRSPVLDESLAVVDLQAGRWLTDDDAGKRVIVIDSKIADHYKIALNQKINLQTLKGILEFEVVGIADRPRVMMSLSPVVIVPMETLLDTNRKKPRATSVFVKLKDKAAAEAFVAEWQAYYEEANKPVQLVSMAAQQKQLNETQQVGRVVNYVATLICLLSAMFIMFTTLTIGIQERSRQLALLRAIGAQRGQIMKLVLAEGITLGFAGLVFGVPMGILWLWLLVINFTDVFIAGLVLSNTGLTYTVLATLGISLIASIYPAWTASQARPLDAIRMVLDDKQSSFRARLLLLGLLLLAIDPLIIFTQVLPRDLLIWSHLLIGIPTSLLGVVLIGPAVVYAVERIFGPVLAWLFRVEIALVRKQLTGHTWRTVGTSTALMLGLMVMMVLQSMAHTWINHTRLPDKIPDVMLAVPMGMNQETWEKVAKLDVIEPGQFLPMAMATSETRGNVFDIMGLTKGPTETIFIGCDVERMFGDGVDEDSGMASLNFVQGTLKDAIARLKKGNHILITEEFHRLKGLGIGDEMLLTTSRKGEVAFTVAGVIRSPGVDMAVRILRINREYNNWTAGGVFGTFTDAQKYYHADNITFFAVNLKEGVRVNKLRADIAALIKQEANSLRSKFSSMLGQTNVHAADTRMMKQMMNQHAGRFTRMLNALPLFAILIASLSVTNTIITSIRSRRWQLGILRSIGMTRSMLFRMVLIEAILIGLVSCLIGTLAGLYATYNAGGLNEVFVGISPDLIINWSMLGIGCGFVVFIALISSAWPAVRVAMMRPLKLLQAGRGAD